MSKRKKKQEVSNRSSSAGYLTFIASVGDSENAVEMRYEDENIWLTQKLMAEPYDVTASAINQHLKRLIADSEIEEDSAIKKFLITGLTFTGDIFLVDAALNRLSDNATLVPEPSSSLLIGLGALILALRRSSRG